MLKVLQCPLLFARGVFFYRDVFSAIMEYSREYIPASLRIIVSIVHEDVAAFQVAG